MKKICKGIISLFLIALIVVCSGCSGYTSRPGKMSKLIGTYKLTEYTYESSEEKDVVHNLIEEESIVCYLVITGNEKGYFYFDSKDMHQGYSDVSLTYEYEQDMDTYLYTDNVKSIVVKSDDELELPGGATEYTMGFVCKIRTKYLNYRYSKSDVSFLNKHLNIEFKYSVKIKFTKVNKDTTTDTIREQVSR